MNAKGYRVVSMTLVLTAVLALMGCAHRPPIGGILYSDCTLPAVWSTATPHGGCDFHGGPPYENIGPAKGEASSLSVLGLVWVGDAGAGTAYEKALHTARADALLNPRIDYRGFGVLGLFAQITTKVQGEGIKFR